MNHPQEIFWLLVGISNATHHIMVLGWLKKEERMKEDDFWPFQVCHFKLVIYIAITTADWGRCYKLLYVLLDASICSLTMISLCKR